MCQKSQDNQKIDEKRTLVGSSDIAEEVHCLHTHTTSKIKYPFF